MAKVDTLILHNGGIVRTCNQCNRPARRDSNTCQYHDFTGEKNPNYKTGEYTKERQIAKTYARNPELKALYDQQQDELHNQIERHQDAITDTGILIAEIRNQIANEHDTEKRIALLDKLEQVHTKRAHLESTLQGIQLKTTAYLTLEDSMRVAVLMETALQKIARLPMPAETRTELIRAIQEVNTANPANKRNLSQDIKQVGTQASEGMDTTTTHNADTLE